MSAVPCPVCQGSGTFEFLRRRAVPVHQNLVVGSEAEARAAVRGELAMRMCRDCGFVHNAEFDASRLAYGAGYDNTQSHSPFFLDYMRGRARHLTDEAGVRGSRIVEVGCGKGLFLRLLVEEPSHGNTGVGFDPSYVGPAVDLDGRLRFERRYYDGSCSDVPADVVVCRHVIEHVADPLGLLAAVRAALAHAARPRIFFETPCVEWILRNQVIWDFFYEHCSLFTAGSLRLAFERSGFAVQSVRHVFGGQYLWLEATVGATAPSVPADADGLSALAARFAAAETELRDGWRSRIAGYARSGAVAIWGAGAKGTTFANLVDPERRIVDCVVDLNPNKQGRYVAGAGHPIVGPEALATRGVRHAILMNPNYRTENEALLRRLGAPVLLVE